MNYYHVILFLLTLAVAVTALAPKTRIPYPVLLMLAGIAVGFIPGLTNIEISSNIVFLLFLPPILYDAAIKIPFPEFRRNLGTISMLAFTMVLITMTAIAVVARYAVPGVTWPVAFVIGAILSPPDAVAASAVLGEMKLPGRTKVILEGESLVNDASALTAYRIALGVIMGEGFTFWKAGLEFIGVIAGGAAIGMVYAVVFAWVLRKVPFSSTATVCLNILLPFAAYQTAETFDVSGVIAVVTAGLLISRRIHQNEIFSEMTIVQSRSVWEVIVYLLNGLVFLMIGLEFPQVMEQIPRGEIMPLVFSGMLIFLIALVVRIIIIFEQKYRQDNFNLHGRGRSNTLWFSGQVRRRMNTLDWKNTLVIGWSGMRGIVSVATALALPATLADGNGFVQRNSIIFLTVVVVILMLIIQGLGLPLLIRWLRVDTTGQTVDTDDSN